MAGKPKDRVGNVYGKLTVVSISEKRTSAGAACWNALCECGNMRNDIPGDNLFYGTRKNRKSVSCCLSCARSLQSGGSIRKAENEEIKRREESNKRRAGLIGLVPDDWLSLPLTAGHARELNQNLYFNAEECPNGHRDLRRADRGCVACAREWMNTFRQTPEGKAMRQQASKARWADPTRKAEAQARRAAWAQTEKGKENLRKSYKSFYENNRDRLMQIKAARSRERYHEDHTFRLRRNLARRVILALKNQQTTKSETTLKLTGCNLQDLKRHIENQFEDWMTWDNMGTWHIDHVRPCGSFDLSDSDQQKVCFNWRNLQPLDGDENYLKKDTYTATDEIKWKARMMKLGYEGELFLIYLD
jgi:hypothetical protein